MKKIFKIIMIIVIMSILCVLILFCTKQYRISLMENIRQKIAKTEENTQNINEVTTVDVTNLEDNGNIEHEHIIKTMYNENEHWEECIICGQKQGILKHSLTTVWALNYESCRYDNYATSSCTCGYSYVWYKACIWDGSSYLQLTGHDHSKKCQICGSYIMHDYYRNGVLYSTSKWNLNCTTSNGTRITCNNGGYCPLCKKTWSTGSHSVQSKDGILKCETCNKQFGTYSLEQDIADTSTIPVTYTTVYKINLIGATYYNTLGESDKQNYQINRQTISNMNQAKTEFVVTSTSQMISNMKQKKNSSPYVEITSGGKRFYMTLPEITRSPDITEPTITSVTSYDNTELLEWSKNKPIIITGTENYCNKVKVKIVEIENEENVVFETETNVSSGNYSVSCIPELEVDTNGKKFKAIVTDSCENSAEQEFTIAKVDIIPPKPTSNEEVGGDWAKSKDFTFTATDYGIGEVQIAFNDIKDLKLAKVNENTFSRDYKLTGDVYKSKQLSVMYKDGLGNISMQKITIDKIDNTAPTITNAELHNNKITITANDEHETLGEGSGVVKYRYLASEEKIENPKLTNENSTEILKDEEIKIKDIYKMKYIYAVAEDYVGNISEVYEFKVPELKLTATANPNTENGKGEIILDWSSYDVTDKYFVIYRKKENQEEWEKIVTLEQKLTGSTYTDILANDEAKPNTPSITIIGDTENNNINITSTTSDNGTEYTYYVEAYDSTGTLLSKSD